MSTPKTKSARRPKAPPRPKRGEASWVSTACDLPRLLEQAKGLAWIREETREAFGDALALLIEDVAEVVGELPADAAAERLGVSRSRLLDRKADGWLKGRWRADRAG